MTASAILPTTPSDSDIAEAIARRVEGVRAGGALVHCITNYVTVESCANAVLAAGASPIMSDEPADVADITSICGALVLNIGTLNERSIAGMKVAGARAAELGHPIVLDPVGAGASALRTDTACGLLDTLPVAVVRGNMSEAKALAESAAATQGVDVNPADAVVDAESIAGAVAFARSFAAKAGCTVAITGPIDIVADATRAFAVRNGTPLQGRITGSGCMLSAICGAYAAAEKSRAAADGPADMTLAALSAVAHMGIAGQMAQARMKEGDGTGTFHTYLMDALSLLRGEDALRLARVEAVA